MATTGYGYGTTPIASLPKARDARNNIPCRNLTQYGYCRNEKDGGCMYNHDVASKMRSANSRPESATPHSSKSLNVDSPSFTPSTPSSVPVAPSLSKKAFSPKGSVAPFVPRSKTSFPQSPPTYRPHSQTSPNWRNRDIPEFVPQSFNAQQTNGSSSTSGLADAFNPYADHQPFNGLEVTSTSQQLNPYSTDSTASTELPYYQQNNHLAPLQHHLYANIGPHRKDLEPYQRIAHDFFLPEDLRQELQGKADATLQTLPNSSLPTRVDEFHSLVPLDLTRKGSQMFNWKTWVYKATRSRDGATYVLRRIEGFRVSSESMIAPIRAWEKVDNASIVNIRGVFTTREFGDTSLVIYTDYHPSAKTLAETQLAHTSSQRARPYGSPFVSEPTLWSYIVQLANALRIIHSQGLAARTINVSKVLLTGKNRIRLNGMGIADILDKEDPKGIERLQEEDMQKLGRLMLALASNSINTPSAPRSYDSIHRAYSPQVRECIIRLIEKPPVIQTFLSSIADQTMTVMDGALNLDDGLTSTLMGELENGRLVRLMTKLGFINERQEYNTQTAEKNQWSETGERYYLKLFRDYVFHQVSSDGRPVLDLGHVISCLNKLDAGSEEKVALVTRDEQHVFVVSYKEVKRGMEAAFQDLAKVQRRA